MRAGAGESELLRTFDAPHAHDQIRRSSCRAVPLSFAALFGLAILFASPPGAGPFALAHLLGVPTFSTAGA
jgi:hypothetical protein